MYLYIYACYIYRKQKLNNLIGINFKIYFKNPVLSPMFLHHFQRKLWDVPEVILIINIGANSHTQKGKSMADKSKFSQLTAEL